MTRTAAVFLSVLLLCGCSSGKKRFTLKGTVSCRGALLSSGVVRLYLADNCVAMAAIRPDGTFEATDVCPGEARVAVEEDARERYRFMPPPPGAWAVPPPVPRSQASAELISIPACYRDVNTSGLVFILTSGRPVQINLE